MHRSAAPEVLEIAADPRLSLFQRGERVYEVLYKLRNPRLSQALDRFAAQKKIAPPAGLDSDHGSSFF